LQLAKRPKNNSNTFEQEIEILILRNPQKIVPATVASQSPNMVSWLGSPLCHRASAEATTDKELTNRPIMKTYDKIKTSYIHAIPNKERKMLM